MSKSQSDNGLHVLDQIDSLILAELEHDGRATVKSLAAALGVSRTTVHSRLDELRAKDVFRVIGLVDPALLGRPAVVVFLLHVQFEASQVLADIWKLPEITWAASMTDSTTILAQGSFASLAAVSEFTDTLRGQRAIRDVEPHILTTILNPAHSPGGDGPLAWYVASTRSQLDPMDLAIAQVLQSDGRATFAHLSRAAELSVAATRQRTLKLIAAGVVHIRTIIDPAARGKHWLGVICIKVRDNATSVIHEVASLADLHYADLTLGTYPILAEFHCLTMADLAERRAQVEQIKGVHSTDLLLIEHSETYGGSWI